MLKKFSRLLFLSTLFMGSKAIAQDYVLVELFSNYACGPCKRFEPMFDSVVGLNSEKVRVIKYSTGFPGTGGFFKYNYVDQIHKQVEYKVGGVPLVFINGTLGGPMDFTTEAIEQQYNRKTFATINGNAIIDSNMLQLNVSVKFDSLSNDTLVLWAAVVAGEFKQQLRQLVPIDTFVINDKKDKGSTRSFSADAMLINMDHFKLDKTNVVAVLQRKKNLHVVASQEIVPVLE